MMNEPLSNSDDLDSDLLYWVPNGVQLLTIENDKVMATSPPTYMAIFKVDQSLQQNVTQKPCSNSLAPGAFLQVGCWAYPLIHLQTAILRCDMGIYIVPNPTTDNPDLFIGIIFPRGMDPALEQEFIDVVSQFAVVKLSETLKGLSDDQKQKLEEKISRFLITTGDKLSQCTAFVAQKTSLFLAQKGQEYRATLDPTCTSPVNVNPAVRNSVYFLHKGGKMVAKVTQFLLNRVGDVGVFVGQKVVGGLRNGSASNILRSTAVVVSGGVTAASTVWVSLEDGAKTLTRSLASETTQIVQLRHGDEASETAHHLLYGIGHMTMAGFQISELGPRSIAGRMARKAGIQIMRDMSVHGGYPTNNIVVAQLRKEGRTNCQK